MPGPAPGGRGGGGGIVRRRSPKDRARRRHPARPDGVGCGAAHGGGVRPNAGRREDACRERPDGRVRGGAVLGGHRGSGPRGGRREGVHRGRRGRHPAGGEAPGPGGFVRPSLDRRRGVPRVPGGKGVARDRGPPEEGRLMARRPIIAANWKMHNTHLEAIQSVQKLSYLIDSSDTDRVEVVICPPFTALRSVQTVIEGDRLPFGLGAQNCHFDEKGAFTGEVSPRMLSALKCSHVVVGHSERRQHFGETDEMVAKKVRAVYANGMTPILCVGESLAERDAGHTEEKVTSQVRGGLGAADAAKAGSLVIAYEPIWAIGTGRNAEPTD